MPCAAELLAAYDAQARAYVPARLPPAVVVEPDGPILRLVGLPAGGFVLYRDLDGLERDELGALIARQVRVFSERREPFEWKLHGHDRPADLPARLRAAGFVAEETETVVIAPLAGAAYGPGPPAGRGHIDTDSLGGTGARDVLCGLRGDDSLEGFGGNDRLLGGPGTTG